MMTIQNNTIWSLNTFDVRVISRFCWCKWGTKDWSSSCAETAAVVISLSHRPLSYKRRNKYWLLLKKCCCGLLTEREELKVICAVPGASHIQRSMSDESPCQLEENFPFLRCSRVHIEAQRLFCVSALHCLHGTINKHCYHGKTIVYSISDIYHI